MLVLGLAVSAAPSEPASGGSDVGAVSAPSDLDLDHEGGETTEGAVGEAAPPWPPAPLGELPSRDPARASVERAWLLPAESIGARVARTQRAGLALGIRSLDGVGRAILRDPTLGDELARAEHAVAIAPGLPAARAALAAARFHTRDPRGGVKAFGAALAAIPHHLEARAWTMAVTGALLVALAVAWAGIFFLLGAVASLPALVQCLGASVKLPGPAALVAIVIPVLALGWAAGPAGAVLGLAALAMASGGASKRLGVCAVGVLSLLALHQGALRGAEGRLLLAADPVATAAHHVESGLATPSELGLVLRASARDWDAARAAALAAKRAGESRVAAEYFARVIEERPDAEAHNNTANVAFAQRDLPLAIQHYEAATQLAPSALAYFNLSQAYGQAIRLDDQDRALSRAQLLDLAAVEQLAGLATGKQPFVADMALSVEDVLKRARATGAPLRLAAASRERIAAGWLGADLTRALAVAVLALGGGLGLGVALERAAGPRNFYADLARTLRGGALDSAQRVAQLTRLRARRARNERLLTLIALIVPGAAGFRFGRHTAALLASLACAGAYALWIVRGSAPADPLALGVLPSLALQTGVVVCAALYLAATAFAFALRAEE